MARPDTPYAAGVVRAIILVMAEFSVGDSPLWYRGSREDVGEADAEQLGLSRSLRQDLLAWNDVYESRGEPDFAWPSAAVHDTHRVDAFALAARVQLELGDDVHVWCGAGDGIDTVHEAGTAIVLQSERAGTDVEFLHDGHRDVRTALGAGASHRAAQAIVHWRALTRRVDTPFGDAETRALGLRTAGQVQADVGPRAQVVSTGGVSAPYRIDEVG